MKKLIIAITLAGLVFTGSVITLGFKQDKGIGKASQKDLDMSITPAKLSVTGTPLGDVSIAHDGRDISADSSFRDSYTNMRSPNETIKPGTIFTKRAYVKNKNGSKGNLEMIFAMIKREKGYYPAGGNWEYITIEFDKLNDYKLHPNGKLPQKIDDESRGKISFCTDCHKKASGKDFVFSN